MSHPIFPLRLSRQDRQRFSQAARAEKKTLAQWLRDAGRERSSKAKRRAACLDYRDAVELSPEAERDPKAFIRSKLNGLHR